jgi:hypothetical protein
VIPQIEAVVEAYREFYRPERLCGCTEGHRYPYNVDSQGLPAVCLAHEWDRQQRLLREMLVRADLSMPIPSKVRLSSKVEKLVSEVDIYSNPTKASSLPIMRSTGSSDVVALGLAWYLSQLEWDGEVAKRQHIVVYLDKSTVITNTFQKREMEMRDVLTYAPVLVYWANPDGRNNCSWILNTVRSRPCGLAFVIE